VIEVSERDGVALLRLVETGLPGWPCRTRTQKRRRKLSL